MQYVFVYGGVFSGVGKGVVTAAIARMLRARGARVSVVKIDPYLNYDAGTLRPTEHGEVWVTWDGVETDMDLGTYERFLGERISGKNNITSGKVYLSVIEDEREGKYLGKTVQIIPHLVERVEEMINEAGEGKDIVVVEIGGVVGDYENLPFLFAAKELERRVGKEHAIHVLVAYFPLPPHLGEMKTKPAQHAVRALSSTGIFPDFLVGRAPKPLDEQRKRKMEQSVHVPAERVISLPDVENIYRVPLMLEEEGMGRMLAQLLELPKEAEYSEWEERLERMENPRDEVDVAIVGKYVKSGAFELPDSYVSIREALVHAWAETGIRPNIMFVDANEELGDYEGIIVPGGFGSKGVEGKIRAIKKAREEDIPFLGLCYGMQLAVVEVARDVGGLNAHTTEVNPNTPHPVIDLLPEQRRIHRLGGTMRLGEYAAHIEKGSVVWRAYEGSNRWEEAQELARIFWERGEGYRVGRTTEPFIFERHRHRYEVNPKYIGALEEWELHVSGWHVREDGETLVEFVEISDHPFFVGTQPHPEYKSRFLDPAPLFVAFLRAAAQ